MKRRGLIWGAVGAGSAAALIAADRINHLAFVKDVQAARLLAPSPPDAVITSADLEGLPLPVKNYLEAAGVVGKRRIKHAYVAHSGLYRVDVHKGWRPINGEYHLLAGRPGFLWYGKVQVAPFVFRVARDSLVAGKGRLRWKLMSVVNVADQTGPEVDQGALSRLLSLLLLVPTMLLPSDHLQWEALNATSARAYLRDGDLQAEAVFQFGASDVTVTVERLRAVGDQWETTGFVGVASDMEEFGGIRIPTRLLGSWKLPDGSFPFEDFCISQVVFD